MNNEQEEFSCAYCLGRIFFSKRNLIRHISSKHSDRDKIYYTQLTLKEKRCLHCHNHFEMLSLEKFKSHNRYYFFSHMYTYTRIFSSVCYRNPEREYFTRKNAMLCSICDKKFYRKANLWAHYSKAHENAKNVILPHKPETIDQQFNNNLHAFVSDQLDPAFLIDVKHISKTDSSILGAKAFKLSFCLSDLALKISSYGMLAEVNSFFGIIIFLSS